MSERIEDVIAEMRWFPNQPYDGEECCDWCKRVRGFGARITAALERERAAAFAARHSLLVEGMARDRMAAAILKVAEEMEKASRANEKFGWTPSAEQARMGDWAAELRRIAGGESWDAWDEAEARRTAKKEDGK